MKSIPDTSATENTPSTPKKVNPFDAIAQQVLEAIGTPSNLRLVQVKPLWRDHYRVNVMTETTEGSMRVSHSYFLKAQDGQIIESTPALVCQYRSE